MVAMRPPLGPLLPTDSHLCQPIANRFQPIPTDSNRQPTVPDGSSSLLVGPLLDPLGLSWFFCNGVNGCRVMIGNDLDLNVADCLARVRQQDQDAARELVDMPLEAMTPCMLATPSSRA